ncbi:DUF5753 domain-containing protein [Nocardia huaxiensis]|uniref:DUF5753 domain-containing protein n=1 Tax=Nocardia huaxiensis TaxID=2755382 RepID=UPI001E385E39|nr:DUF5753 domain-containing protein [Nocardia huaxiensis]UFS98786.1 DUF5753 domain-containing protein [Nocardia huaxiensis]
MSHSWWPDTCGAAQVAGLQSLLDLARPQQIRRYANSVIPDLLQTRAYARATLSGTHSDRSGIDVEQEIDTRLRTQRSILAKDGPTLWILIEEAALLRPIVESTVWGEQLDHLIRVAQRPNIVVQILTHGSCGPAQIDHSFTYFRFQDRRLPDLACVRLLTGTHCHDQPHETERYRETFVPLACLAMRPTESIAHLTALRHTVLGS